MNNKYGSFHSESEAVLGTTLDDIEYVQECLVGMTTDELRAFQRALINLYHRTTLLLGEKDNANVLLVKALTDQLDSVLTTCQE